MKQQKTHCSAATIALIASGDFRLVDTLQLLLTNTNRFLHYHQLQQNMEAKTVLHILPRVNARCVNASPACVKLESFLRMANIDYEVSFAHPFHIKTKKTPWLEWRGEQLADSSLIIERLSADINYDDGLSDREWAVARFLQKMIDENTQVVGGLHRWVYSDNGAWLLKQLSLCR